MTPHVKPRRINYSNAYPCDKGAGYNYDLGSIAFSDYLEANAKRKEAKRRQYEKVKESRK